MIEEWNGWANNGIFWDVTQEILMVMLYYSLSEVPCVRFKT